MVRSADPTIRNMPGPLTKKFTLTDLRSARSVGNRIAMLSCYDFSMARLMHEAGVPAILVGDSASNVVLGYDTTLPVSLAFMIEITRAVRRGAPLSFLIGDMPFGSYQASAAQAVRNVSRMVKQTGCDAVKLDVSIGQKSTIRALTEAGVAVIVHLGLKPQSVGLLGSYRFQGRTAVEANEILDCALQMEEAGAVAILLEAVPPEVAAAVVERTKVPIIGCGAGPACHACVIVTHDGLGLTPHRPRFVPSLVDIAPSLKNAFAGYVQSVVNGQYPAAEHDYVMPPAEKAAFVAGLPKQHEPSGKAAK